MGDYCENNEVTLKETVNAGALLFNEQFSGVEITFGVFIDRGYLRLVDVEDSQCLDHGEKVKINYCPICGRKIRQGILLVRVIVVWPCQSRLFFQCADWLSPGDQAPLLQPVRALCSP